MTVNWNDRSDNLCSMHSIHLGALTLDVYRAHVGDPWCVDLRRVAGITNGGNWRIDASADDARARALALAFVLPMLREIAARAAECAADVAVAVANARLEETV